MVVFEQKMPNAGRDGHTLLKYGLSSLVAQDRNYIGSVDVYPLSSSGHPAA